MTETTTGTVKVEAKTEEKSKNALLREAYGAATTALREQNRDAFNKLYAAEAKKRGIEWAPKPSQEDKDRAEMLRILKDHPALAEELAASLIKD